MTVINIRYLVKDKRMLISVDGEPYISEAMLTETFSNSTQKIAISDVTDSKADYDTYFIE